LRNISTCSISFRKNGKVVIKELYLGKNIPDNIEEIKVKLLFEAKETLLEKLNYFLALY